MAFSASLYIMLSLVVSEFICNGVMNMAMNMMRPGLFFQREGPGSEPGNSLLCPDEAPRSLCAVS